MVNPQNDGTVIEALGHKLRTQFNFNESFRRAKEEEWLSALRQHKGIYDPEVEALLDKNRSRVYPKITRSKDISIEARMHEIAFPDIGKPWGIGPTPNATISKEAVDKLLEQIMLVKQAKVQQYAAQMQEQGQQPDPGVIQQIMSITDEEMQRAIAIYAKRAGQEMETEVEDQLVETQWVKKAKQVMRSGIYLGTGVMKNPMVTMVKDTKWEFVNGQYSVVEREIPSPELSFVRVWDVYPDMSVVNFEDSEGIFERHVMTKHEVRGLAKRPDFDKDKIYLYLAENPDGNCDFKWWEIMLQQLNADAIYSYKRGRKYEVLEYWGYVDAKDLAEVGMQLPLDPDNPGKLEEIEFEVCVWILGTTVIKAVMNPMPKGNPAYSVFYFEKDDSSVFGNGLPYVMKDTQETVCAASRMVLDNGAISAGAQIELNIDLIDDDQDYDNIYPNKMWFRKGRGVESQHPAVRVYSIDSHITEYLAIIKQFMEFGDLETAFPTYMLIEPQKMGNETAQGASIRSSTVNITIKDLVKAWDEFVEAILTAIYRWNMEFSDREEIKGDYTVKATGLSSLVAKELRSQIMQNLNTTLTDEDKTWIKKHDYLEELFKVLDMPLHILRTEEEHDQHMTQITDQELAELQKEGMKANIEKTRALALSNSAGARKKNTEAITAADQDHAALNKEKKVLDNRKIAAETGKMEVEAASNVVEMLQPKPKEASKAKEAPKGGKK